jgi:hypothetical protein
MYQLLDEMMDEKITPELFARVRDAVERVCQRAQKDRMLIVTEADLQSWIFVELTKDSAICDCDVYVHTQINYLKEEDCLGHVPDIVLLPSSSYSVNPDGGLHDRKGYTIWGSSIALELKLLRSHRRDGFILSVKEDLAKLKCIRERHYNFEQVHKFFAASVILCRQHLSASDVAQLRMASAEAKVEIWIFNIERGAIAVNESGMSAMGLRAPGSQITDNLIDG